MHSKDLYMKAPNVIQNPEKNLDEMILNIIFSKYVIQNPEFRWNDSQHNLLKVQRNRIFNNSKNTVFSKPDYIETSQSFLHLTVLCKSMVFGEKKNMTWVLLLQ